MKTPLGSVAFGVQLLWFRASSHGCQVGKVVLRHRPPIDCPLVAAAGHAVDGALFDPPRAAVDGADELQPALPLVPTPATKTCRWEPEVRRHGDGRRGVGHDGVHQEPRAVDRGVVSQLKRRPVRAAVCLEAGKTASRGEKKGGNGSKTGRKEQKSGSEMKLGWNQGVFRSLWSRAVTLLTASMAFFARCKVVQCCNRTILTASLRDATLLCASFPSFRFASCWAIILHSLREESIPDSLFPVPNLQERISSMATIFLTQSLKG